MDATSYSLIGHAKARHDGAWDRLWSVYSDYVRYRVRRGGVPEAAVEDVTQEVFATVSGRLEEFEPRSEVGSFRRWLQTIARSRAADHLRKEGRTPGDQAAGSHVFAAAAAEPEDDAEAEAVVALYGRTLALVETDFKESTNAVFRLCVLEGVPAVEAAARLGMKPPAVRMAVSRVLDRLREVLG